MKPRSRRRVGWRITIPVLRSVERRAAERGVNVEDVLSAPSRGVRFVLVGAQTPLGAAGHRIDRHPPEELQLASGGVVGGGDAIDQRVEVGGIAFVAEAHLERRDLAQIRCVLVLVDRRADFPQGAPELGLAVPRRGDAGERHHGGGQDHDDGRYHDQLDERVAGRRCRGSARARAPRVPQPCHWTMIVTGR